MTRTKLLLSICAFVAGVVVSGGLKTHAAILFSDSFDRSPAGALLVDIDAVTTGISAAFPLPSVVYIEREEFLAGPLNAGPLTQDEANALTHVENDQLHLAYGPNASVTHINHNFVGAGIKGMKASFDVVSNDGMADTVERWVGIGFGGSQAEAEAAVYDFRTAPAGPGWKGHQNGTTADSGFADFFVAWERGPGSTPDSTGRIAVYRNGVRGTVFNNGGALYPEGGTLEVDLSFDDFGAGTTVTADISYGGTLFGTETFNWQFSETNYIGITARQDLDGWTIDNLKIEATIIPEPTSLAFSVVLIVVCGAASRMRRI